MRSFLDPTEQTEPSVNMEAMTANEPRWREESFQITPKRMPVRLETHNAERPVTHQVKRYDMVPGRAPVMVRSSNRRPVEAGEGMQSEVWSVSDPFAPHNSPRHAITDPMALANEASGGAIPGMGENPTAAPTGVSIGKLVLGGALLGAFVYLMNRR